MTKLIMLVGLLSTALTACEHRPGLAQSTAHPNPLTSLTDSIDRHYDPRVAGQRTYQLDTFFRALRRKNAFNGVVLVAQYGKVLYQGAFGYANFTTKDTLTPQTTFQLASVSKQFTAVAVMILKERGQLHYEDSIQRFYPDFPYHGITVRQLLSHRSGLPNYVYFCDGQVKDAQTPISNQDVVALLTKHQPKPYATPNTRFQYNNSNYCLLAAIVEKVTGQPFEDFAQEQIFCPLGMHRTLVYNKARNPTMDNCATGYNGPNRPAGINYLNGVTGDKGVYSTAEDLLKWENALYTDQLVKQSTLQEAFTPAHPEPKLANYGLGWRILTPEAGAPVVFHGGWWQGFNTYLLHGRRDHSTIIWLTNLTNHSLEHVKTVQAILAPTAVPASAQPATEAASKSNAYLVSQEKP